VEPGAAFGVPAHVGTTVGFGAAIALGLAAVLSSSVLLALIAVFIALQCHQERQLLREGLYHVEDGAFGYDFSQGYTSLEGRAGSVERPPRPRRPWFWQRWRREREVRSLEESMSQELAMRSRVEALLEKISTQGIEALTAEERAFLQTASKKFG
jgi:stage IV sporulation protein FB